MKYVITAVNRMTGEREAVSSPHNEWKARKLLEKWQHRMYTGYGPRAWKNPKMEPAATEGCLF